MDSYEQRWRAQVGTWAQLEREQERAKSDAEWRERDYQNWVRYYGKAYADERRAEQERSERAALERRLLARTRDAALIPLLKSLTPVNHWVGAAWVDPKGNLYPVRYCDHCARSEELAPHHYPDEIGRIRERDGWVDCAEFLRERKGWLRIGADGLVGDHRWTRVSDMRQAQLDAISSMLQRSRERGGASDYKETGSFTDGLHTSVRFAMGEVNEDGETWEEVRRRDEEYEHLRRRYAREDEERARIRAEADAEWQRQQAERAAREPVYSW